MRDEAMLRKVGDYIAEHPEEYDQSFWAQKSACGTTHCVAGTTVFLSPEFQTFIWYQGSIFTWSGMFTKENGEYRSIMLQATYLLGLDCEEAYMLFNANWLPKWAGETDYSPQMIAPLVRDALYALADGATIEDVTDHSKL